MFRNLQLVVNQDAGHHQRIFPHLTQLLIPFREMKAFLSKKNSSRDFRKFFFKVKLFLISAKKHSKSDGNKDLGIE